MGGVDRCLHGDKRSLADRDGFGRELRRGALDGNDRGLEAAPAWLDQVRPVALMNSSATDSQTPSRRASPLCGGAPVARRRARTRPTAARTPTTTTATATHTHIEVPLLSVPRAAGAGAAVTGAAASAAVVGAAASVVVGVTADVRVNRTVPLTASPSSAVTV